MRTIAPRSSAARNLPGRTAALALAAVLAVGAWLPPTARIASEITDGLVPPIPAAAAVGTPCSNYSDSYPMFTGWLSDSAGTMLTRSTTGSVYGRVDNVDQTWDATHCYAYRYDGIAWTPTGSTSNLTVDWGALSGDGNACRYVANTKDYLHANAGACPSSSTTARLVVSLSPELTYRNSTAFTAPGQFAFTHSDCYTWYTAEKVVTGATTGSTSGKPGANCGNKAIDGTGTTQDLDYDKTAPTAAATGQGTTGVTVGAGNPAIVATAAVTLYLGATDAVSGLGQMDFSNDNVNWSSWQAYAASASWTLSAGDGAKTVYARFRDANGNTSTVSSDTVTLDTAAPVADITWPAANQPLMGEAVVAGVAADAVSFQGYTLDYGTGSSPSAWTTIATSSSPVASGGTLATWATAPLATGTYTLRLTVRDTVGNTPSVVSRLVYVDNTRRGDEPYLARIPFDLGGGWSLDAGVATGEASLSCSLFSIPSWGPAAGLDLAYNSGDLAAAGPFGWGWSSNLTQTLTADGTFLVWRRADGGRVPFGQVAGTWTPLGGHFEKLAPGTGADAGRNILTLTDQTRYVFEGSGAGRLLRIDNRFGKSLSIAWGTGTATATDAQGRTTTLTYTGSQITSVQDSAGRAWAFHYSAASDLDLITEPDPDGAGPLTAPATPLGYDTSHHLTTATRHRRTATVQDEASWTDSTITWTVGYDTAGRVNSVVDPVAHDLYGSVDTTFGYATGQTTVNRLKTYSPVARNTSVYAVDGSGRMTSLTDPNGGVTNYAWNSPSNTLAHVDVPVSGTTWSRTSYTYTAAGAIATEDAGATVTAGNGPITLPTTTRYVYNASNDVTETHVADGTGDETVTTAAYDTAGTGGTPGHLQSVTRNGSETTQYDYDANDELTAERDPAGIVTRHWYTSGNETQTVANCTGGASWQTCDASGTHDAATNVTTTSVFTLTTTAGKLGLPDSTTAVLTGRTVQYTYDELGRVRTEIDAAGTTDRRWDELGNEVQTTLPGSLVTTRTLDQLDQVTTELAPLQTTTTSYDATGAVISTTTAGDTVSRTYDGAGNLLSETVDPGTAPHLNLTTEHAYDASGRETATRDPRGTITVTVYDADGRVSDTYANCTTSGTTIPSDWQHCTGLGTADRTDGTYNLHTSFTYDDRGNKLSETAPNGRLTTWTYDDLDRVTRVVDNDVAAPALPTEDVTTEYAFDAAGNQVAVKSPTTAGGAAGYQVSRSFFDALGRVTRTIADCTDSGTTPPASWATCTGTGTHDAATNLETTFTYDADGHTLSATGPDPAATSGTSTATVTTRYAYDPAGRLCRVVEHSTQTDAEWAALPDRCTTAVSGTVSANTSTRYTYDPAGNLASMIDAAGHTTAYGYDTAGHMTSLTDADGGLLAWTYDAAGRRTSQRNRTDTAPAVSVTWTYDAAGRMLTRTADSTVTSYTYDANGNRLTATTGAMTITATYDRLSRVLTVDDEDAGTTSDTTYTYSLASPTWTDPTGSYTATLDTSGRPTAETTPAAGSWAFTYGATGQVTSAVQGNGNTITSTFDAAGRELTRTTKTGATTRASYTWTFNRAGLVLAEASSITGDVSNGTVAYTYDPLGRLASSTLGATVPTTWDAATNRTGQGSSTTAFDPANRPTSGTSPTTAYSSDQDGRLTGRPGQTLAWDHLGRLASVTTASGTTSYTYDPLDRLRTVQAPSGARTRFRYTGLTTSAAAWIDDLTGTVTRSLANSWTGEHLADWDPAAGASSRRVYGTNAHHDVTWLADSAGSVIASLRYDPWGVPRATPPSGYTPFRFQGSWTDTGTDLSWAVTRWYAPSLGTFISEDSLLGDQRDPGSRHLYAYGQGEPVARWDPDGRQSYKLVARLGIVDPVGIELTALQLIVWWTSKQSCCVGLPVVASEDHVAIVFWYRYLNDWGGWEQDRHNSWVKVTEGGLGKTWIGVKAHQGFKYFGPFSAICPLCYNTLDVSISAKATGRGSGCTFNYIFRQNTFGLMRPAEYVCRWD